MSSLFQGLLPSLAMMLTMAVGSAAILGVAVVAPDAAPDIGVRATEVGIFSGLVYFFAMFSGSYSTSFIARFGPVRVLQATAVLAVAGLASMTLASPVFALLCALLLGLAYGPINPANADVMMAVTTEKNRSFLFSIKQSGVTFGGAFAALVVPPIVVWLNWKISVLAIAILGIISILILQPMHKKYDQNTTQVVSWSPSSIIRPVGTVLKVPLLRGFSVVGFIYAGVQVSVASFFVVYLVQNIGFDLVSAGACFLFVNIGGIVGRLCWGIVADRFLSPKLTLVIIGIISASSIFGMLVITLEWNVILLYLFAFILGGSTHSWNGVYLSEIASRAPKGMAPEWTGGVQFIFYGGVAAIPPLFGVLIWTTNNFEASFVAIAIAVLVAGLYLPRLYKIHASES